MSAAVGVKLQAFNWRMWQARKAAGLTQSQLGLLTDIPAQRIGTIETLRSRPTRTEQDEIASALALAVDDVFPAEVLDLYGTAAATVRMAVPARALHGLRDGIYGNPAQLVSGLREQIDDVVGMLKPRERDVIRKRFGLAEGDSPRTLTEVGREAGLTVERVRQIEAKALRNLRQPTRSRLLKPYIESDDTRIPQGRAPTVAGLREGQA